MKVLAADLISKKLFSVRDAICSTAAVGYKSAGGLWKLRRFVGSSSCLACDEKFLEVTGKVY